MMTCPCGTTVQAEYVSPSFDGGAPIWCDKHMCAPITTHNYLLEHLYPILYSLSLYPFISVRM